MKYRIEISGRGGEVVIGKVKREFYDLFEGDDAELDLHDYIWNYDFFEENEGVEIPEDIRPCDPGLWFDCNDIAHEYGVSVDYAFVTITQGDEILYDNAEVNTLENSEGGLTLESESEVVPDEQLEDGDAYLGIQTFEKGFFYSYEFEAVSFDLSKLTFYVNNIDGWELISGARYDDQELEDLGELSTEGKGTDVWLRLVEKS